MIQDGFRKICVGKNRINRVMGALKEIAGHGFELFPRDSFIQFDGRTVQNADGRNQHAVRLLGAQGDLAFFGFFLDAGGSAAILPQILSVDSLKAREQVLHQTLVEIFSAQLVVTAGSFDFQHTVEHFQQGYIEGAAAEIIYEDMTFLLQMIKPVTQGCGGRLIQNALDCKTGKFSGANGFTALHVVKIGGNGDYSPVHIFTEIFRGIASDIGEKFCLQLNRSVFCSSEREFFGSSGFSLYLNGSIFRIQKVLCSRLFPDDPVSARINPNGGRGDHGSIRIWQEFHLPVTVYGGFSCGCAEVDADDDTHDSSSSDLSGWVFTVESF